MFLFSILILTLEQQRSVFPPSFRANLERYFLFITLIAGRGMRILGVVAFQVHSSSRHFSNPLSGGFYIYIGMTQAAVNWKSSPFSLLVGLFIIFVGALYIHTGISVGTKLHQLRESLQSPEAIKHAFMTVRSCVGVYKFQNGCFFKLSVVEVLASNLIPVVASRRTSMETGNWTRKS